MTFTEPTDEAFQIVKNSLLGSIQRLLGSRFTLLGSLFFLWGNNNQVFIRLLGSNSIIPLPEYCAPSFEVLPCLAGTAHISTQTGLNPCHTWHIPPSVRPCSDS